MPFGGRYISIKGNSHIVNNKPCQDRSGIKITDSYAIGVVSDGHGGSKYIRSDIGSKLAVDTSIETLSEYLSDMEIFQNKCKTDVNETFRTICNTILARWRASIKKYDDEHPETEDEADFIKSNNIEIKSYETKYGATLVISVLTNFCNFGIQLGDGDIVVTTNAAEKYMPMPVDEMCVGNVTTSLCSLDASRYMRYYYEDNNVIAATISSDGLITTFQSEESFERYCRNIVSMMDNPEESWTKITLDLIKRSKCGKEDDVSLALIYNTDVDYDLIKSMIQKEYAASKQITVNNKSQRRNKSLNKMKKTIKHYAKKGIIFITSKDKHE